MKTFKLSMILLIVIILGALWYMHVLNDVSNQMVSELDQLEKIIESDNWTAADRQLDTIQKHWEKTEKWMTTVVDHSEIDAIKLTFARLSQYVHYRKTAEFMAESASLKLLIQHIPNKEKISLANLF